jgi:DHA1 family tetracycline resistance protein-like MFS transporter
LGGIAGPAMQAVISSKVDATEQGEIQGTLSSLMSVSTIIGPLLMTNVFHYFTNDNAPFKFAGAPFVLGATLMLFSAVVAYFSFKKK